MVPNLFRIEINFHKRELMGVNVDHSLCVELASQLGSSFPSTYLGLPLCKGEPNKSCWDKVIEKMERRLSLWKRTYLFIANRLTSIKFVLSSLPLYFLSMLKCPVAAVKNVKAPV